MRHSLLSKRIISESFHYNSYEGVASLDQDTFLSLAEQYKDTVFRVALNYLGNTYDADDIVQNVFMKLFLRKRPFENDNHARYWLIRVTVNSCKDFLKSSWKSKNVFLDEVELPVSFEEPEQEDLYKAVMALPEKYRTVLYLFYYEDFTIKEIARLMKMNVSSVTTRLSRARKQLKEALKDEE